MRHPRDFFQPQAIGAPEPLREIPVKPSRMIHFLDFSNEKMVAKASDIAAQTDILLGNLEDAIPVDRKEAARAGPDQGGEGVRLRPDLALDPGQLAREPLGPRRPDDPGHRDRRPARGRDGAEGRGRLGHRLRRPPPRPARGEGQARAADPDPRDPRDRAGRRQRRGNRLRQPADAGDELRAGRPRRLAADEDDPGRRRPPRLPLDGGPEGPREPRGRPGQRPAGPVALLDRAHGRRLRLGRDPALLRPVRRHQGHRRLRDPVPRRLPARLRRRLVAAPGPDRHREEGLQPAGRRGQVREEGAGGDPRRRAAST